MGSFVDVVSVVIVAFFFLFVGIRGQNFKVIQMDFRSIFAL